jgi:hypothetical protein
MRTAAGWIGKGPVVMLAAMVILTPAQVRAADDRDGSGEREALRRALSVVKIDSAVRVVLIEPELAPEPEALRDLDAFVVREPHGALRPVIYINRQSHIVRRAAAGSDFYVYVLAAVIHHEAHHLTGASEAEARRAEEEFFRSVIDRGKVPASLGRTYLQLLARRPGESQSSLERE